MTLVKICGLTTPETVDAAIEAGAEYLGFNFYPRSPRVLTLEQAAPLIQRARGRVASVALLVDPDDATLDATVALAPDLIQLHGQETPERVIAVRARTGRPVIKVFPVANASDLAAAADYDADHVMFDAKPPVGADRTGGHGVTFDWSLLLPVAQHWGGGPEGRRGRGEAADGAGASVPLASRPAPSPLRGTPPSLRDGGESPIWFLAGGLTAANVGEAIRVTRAPVVDVSSGVERAPGVKDPALIAAFIRAVRAADAELS